MQIRNIFLYNAQSKDRITIDGTVVTNNREPIEIGRKKTIKDLQVHFMDNYELAVATGVTERLDSIFLNVSEFRGKVSELEIKLLGRRNPIKFGLS